MNNTKIHIVTPCFNSEETISRTITSVISQTGNFDIYYHIQDAESTDNTLSIIDARDKLLKSGTYPILCNSVNFTYNSSPDKGMYDAIVKGFDTALPKNEGWLSWINADDYYIQGAFATIDQINQSSSLPSTIEWITGASSINKEAMTLISVSKIYSSNVIKAGLSDGKFWDLVQQEGTFFKRSLWDKANKMDGFANFRYAGDWNLWRQFAQYAEIYQFKYPPASFSIRDGRLSQMARFDYEKEMEQIISRKERLEAFKSIDAENIKSFYFSTSFKNQSIEIEEKNILYHYKQKAKSLKIDTKYIKVENLNNGEELFEKKSKIMNNRHKIIDNYKLLIKKAKKHSRLGTVKRYVQKTSQYQSALKLFNTLKYEKE